MKGIYYFENNLGCNPIVKSVCEKNGISLFYETKMYGLLSMVISSQPNFIILDGDQTKLDSRFLECLGEESPFYTPLIFVLSDKETTKQLTQSYMNCVTLTYGNFLQNFENFFDAINKADQLKSKVDSFKFTRFDQIMSLLFKINFSIKNQGTLYLKDCIRFSLSCFQNAEYNLGHIYEKVAFLYQTTPSAIERGIRLAIKSAWQHLNKNMCAENIGVDPVFFKKQPTCRELVIFLTELIINQAKEQCFYNAFPVLKARYV